MGRIKALIINLIIFTVAQACKEKPGLEVIKNTNEKPVIMIEKVTDPSGSHNKIRFGEINPSFSLVEIELCQESGSECRFSRIDLNDADQSLALKGLNEGSYQLKLKACKTEQLNSVINSFNCSKTLHETTITQDPYSHSVQQNFNEFYFWTQKMKGSYNKLNYINSVSLYNKINSCGEKYGIEPASDPFYQELSTLIKELEMRVVRTHQESFSDSALALTDGDPEKITQPLGHEKI